MATTAIARVSGRVLREDHREGVKEGRPWSMDLITVLVGGVGTTELILPRDLSVIGGQLPGKGDDVDFTIEVTRSERGFNLAILGIYSETDSLAVLSS